MKPVSITQEILLITTSTFAKRQLCEMNALEENRYMISMEQLEEACWNGLVNELLPEIMQKSPGSEKIFLWQVEMRTSYLTMSLGAYFPVLEKTHALDPHTFLSFREMN